MIVSAHQPHYLPWIGFINKIYLSDVYMMMDNMTYTNNSYINRNRIMTSRGVSYLTVPLIKPFKLKTKINELIIEDQTNANWNSKHLKSIKHNYAKGAGFKDFFPLLEDLLLKKHELYINLLYSNISTILNYLEIKTTIKLASEYNIEGNKEDELMINILKNSNCSELLLGLGASKSYVNFDYIYNRGYNVLIQKFEHPVYSHKSKHFVKGISIIDLILNNSRPDAINIIKNCGKTEALK